MLWMIYKYKASYIYQLDILYLNIQWLVLERVQVKKDTVLFSRLTNTAQGRSSHYRCFYLLYYILQRL